MGGGKEEYGGKKEEDEEGGEEMGMKGEETWGEKRGGKMGWGGNVWHCCPPRGPHAVLDVVWGRKRIPFLGCFCQKKDPAQFLQVHGRACKVHLDSAVALAAESPVNM